MKQGFAAVNDCLSKATMYIHSMVVNHDADVVIKKTNHFQERADERNITMGQVRYVLQRGKAFRLEDSTRRNLCKVGVGGKDFDGKDIVVIVVPGKIGIKLITTYYRYS